MIVLDTHAWIWWAAESKRLSSRARHAIERADELGVCAISCWEVAMLVEKQRLSLDRDVAVWVQQALALERVTLLPLSPEVAVSAARLGPDFQGDPADRMIAATVLREKAELVTKDERLRSWPGLETVW